MHTVEVALALMGAAGVAAKAGRSLLARTERRRISKLDYDQALRIAIEKGYTVDGGFTQVQLYSPSSDIRPVISVSGDPGDIGNQLLLMVGALPDHSAH